MLVANAASNVLGTLLPIGELARIAHDAGAVVVADAAQSAGHSTESPAAQGGRRRCLHGAQGAAGSAGNGGLWVREGVEVAPFLTGGTGGDSRRRRMPAAMPDRLEAGTGNSPGMAGLLAGCAFLREAGVAAIHRREMALKARLRDGLDGMAGLRVLSPPGPDGVPVVTVKADDMDAATLAGRLDCDFGVQTRAGLHCAPEVHRILGTTDEGAVRFSLGWASTREDVDAAVNAVAQRAPARDRAGWVTRMARNS